MKKTVIGLVGPIASGKDTVLDELVTHGFKAYFLGDRTREEADRRGLPHDRAILQNMGNDLREKFGDDTLVKQTEKLIAPFDNRIVIDGIRNKGEIAYIRKKYSALIIGVDATIERRKIFSKKRRGDADPKTKGEFERVEKRDRGIGEGSHGQQVKECLKISDIVIENKGSLPEFRRGIQKVLEKFGIVLDSTPQKK